MDMSFGKKEFAGGPAPRVRCVHGASDMACKMRGACLELYHTHPHKLFLTLGLSQKG